MALLLWCDEGLLPWWWKVVTIWRWRIRQCWHKVLTLVSDVCIVYLITDKVRNWRCVLVSCLSIVGPLQYYTCNTWLTVTLKKLAKAQWKEQSNSFETPSSPSNERKLTLQSSTPRPVFIQNHMKPDFLWKPSPPHKLCMFNWASVNYCHGP